MRIPAALLSSICFLTLIIDHGVAAVTVGVTAAVNQSAVGARPGQSVRTIVLGGDVVFNERITTSEVGLVQILLADGTTFTVGPNSEITIDSFVYNPGAGTAQVAATLTKGVFRFVGGRTSKTENGVALRTPVGSIGIRGAVADLNLGNNDACTGDPTRDRPGLNCDQPTHFDMIFGDRMTLSQEGTIVATVYEPGYSIIVTGESGQGAEVRKTPPEWKSPIQQALAGNPGQTGGSSNQPTNQTVAQSGISETNSAQPPEMMSAALQGAGNQLSPENIENDIGSLDESQSDQIRQTAEELVKPEGELEPEPEPEREPEPLPEPTPEPEPEPPPPPAASIPLRVLFAGSVYDVIGGGTITNPGERGLVGGSPESDQTTTLSVPAGQSEPPTGTGQLSQGSFQLPVYTDTTLTSHQVNGYASPFGTLSGTAYSGPEGFTAYLLAIDGDETQPFYALTGTPTSFDSAGFDTVAEADGGQEIRRYTLTQDPLQDISVPFMRGDAMGAVDNAAVTDLYLAEAESGSSVRSRVFQAWLLIEGQGIDQRSGVGVNVGSLDDDAGGDLGLFSGRRGSYRADSVSGSFTERGGLATVSGPTGGHFFGPDANNFVLMTEIAINDTFADSPNSPGETGEQFSTIHVANLVEKTAKAELIRSDRTLTGYSAGVLETRFTDSGSGAPTPFMSGASPDGVEIHFIPETNALGGVIRVKDTVLLGGGSDLSTYEVAFGFGINGNTAGGGSALIHDNMFAARQNSNGNATFATTDAEETLTHRVDNNPGTYMVSADAVPQSDFMGPGNTICECEFLEWGWWGTQTDLRDPSAANPNQVVRRDGVHLGTWVAGDVADAAELPASGVATYAGHAIGNVINGSAQYVAGGTMNMSWDFGSRSGELDITNFDGRNFGSGPDGIADPYTGDQATASFAGGLSGPLGEGGSVNGSFVKDGVDASAGVIGNFGLTDGAAYSATGIIAGERTSFSPGGT